MLTENGFAFSKLILATGRSDLRRGIDGLAANHFMIFFRIIFRYVIMDSFSKILPF